MANKEEIQHSPKERVPQKRIHSESIFMSPPIYTISIYETERESKAIQGETMNRTNKSKYQQEEQPRQPKRTQRLSQCRYVTLSLFLFNNEEEWVGAKCDHEQE